jgi:hypothetical protein
MRNGSFTADVSIERGFGVFETRGGDFAPRRFESGRGLGDGSGGAIRAVASGGLGGNVLIGRASIGGNLESLVARGGAIEVNLAANRVGLVHATSEASDGLLRPAAESGVHGTFTVMSVDQVTAEGSDITASFTTSDSLHMQMEMTAESDPFGGGGAIYSPYSFLIAGGVALIRATDMEFTLVAGRDVGLVEALTDAFGRPGRLVGNLTAPRFGAIRVLGDRLDVNLFATQPGLSQVDQARFDWIPSADPEQAAQLFVELLGLGASTRLVWDTAGGPVSEPIRVVTSQTAVVAGHAAGARVAGLSLPLSLGGQPLVFTVSDPRLEIRDGQLWLKADQQLDPDSEPQLTVVVSAEGEDHALREAIFVEVRPVDVRVTGVSVRDRVLQIVGTDDDDSIHVLRVLNDYRVIASFLDGPQHVPIADVDRIEIYAEGGDDLVTASYFVTVPVWMFGGPGNDVLIGGSGSDRLFGEAGNDVLWGGWGDDYLDGGDGENVLIGVRGDNVLVSGDVRESLDEEPGSWTDNAASLQVTLVNNLPPWQNPFNPLDVNFDGQVTPHDVLLIVNAVNSAGPGHVLSGLPFQADGGLATLVDSDGDGVLSANDVLRVINHLNNTAAPPADPGEGESPTTTRASSEPPPLPASQRFRFGGDGGMYVPLLPDPLANAAWRPDGARAADRSDAPAEIATPQDQPLPFPGSDPVALLDPAPLAPRTAPVDAAFEEDEFWEQVSFPVD